MLISQIALFCAILGCKFIGNNFIFQKLLLTYFIICSFSRPPLKKGTVLWCFLSPARGYACASPLVPLSKGDSFVVFFNSSSTIRGGAISGGGVRECVFYSPTPPCRASYARHSFGKLKFPSSQTTLIRVVPLV
jgi:predicted outer membrane repeat protein